MDSRSKWLLRFGVALFGVPGSALPEMRSALSWKTIVSALRIVMPGSRQGYCPKVQVCSMTPRFIIATRLVDAVFPATVRIMNTEGVPTARSSCGSLAPNLVRFAAELDHHLTSNGWHFFRGIPSAGIEYLGA